MTTAREHDRRRAPRALTAALVQVVDEYKDTTVCVLEDLSTHGACIHADIALRVDSSVTLKVGSVVHLSAVVKHCQPAGDGFSIGIDFAEGEWKAPIQQPIHWIRTEN